jgi:hypothetical protein
VQENENGVFFFRCKVQEGGNGEQGIPAPPTKKERRAAPGNSPLSLYPQSRNIKVEDVK